jgi:hypothetical protein
MANVVLHDLTNFPCEATQEMRGGSWRSTRFNNEW